jgi:hypothetical protein
MMTTQDSEAHAPRTQESRSTMLQRALTVILP